jgi:thiomorpholine-carboxylate dehydrogenase
MSSAPGVPFLDEAAVRAVLDMDELIPAVERALVDYSAGRVAQPERHIVEVAAHGGFFASMPAVAEGVGVKLVTIYPGNAGSDVPTHQALVVMFRPETGEPLALMDARLITEMRTSAVSAAATKVLAAEDARVLAVLGTGVQARTHVEALRRVRRFQEVRVWGRSPERAERLAGSVGARVAASAEEAVRGAQVVVTATSATEPILRGAWLEPGAHVNAVGWNGVTARELDDEAMAHLVVVESRAGTARDSGNLRGSGAVIHAELGELLGGARRVDPRETTIFDSVGMAAEDMAAAQLVLRRAGLVPG